MLPGIAKLLMYPASFLNSIQLLFPVDWVLGIILLHTQKSVSFKFYFLKQNQNCMFIYFYKYNVCKRETCLQENFYKSVLFAAISNLHWIRTSLYFINTLKNREH
jgi:hypothetical protein